MAVTTVVTLPDGSTERHARCHPLVTHDDAVWIMEKHGPVEVDVRKRYKPDEWVHVSVLRGGAVIG